MASTKPVILSGVHLGDLTTVEKSDWKNREREPTPLDFEKIRVTLAARAVYEILEKHHRALGGMSQEELWPTVVIAAVCIAAKGRKDLPFEEDVLLEYVNKYGMNQIIRSAGGDPARVMEMLERAMKDQPS